MKSRETCARCDGRSTSREAQAIERMLDGFIIITQAVIAERNGWGKQNQTEKIKSALGMFIEAQQLLNGGEDQSDE